MLQLKNLQCRLRQGARHPFVLGLWRIHFMMRQQLLLLRVVLVLTMGNELLLAPPRHPLARAYEYSAVHCGGDAAVPLFTKVAAAPPHAGMPCDLCGTYRWVFVISTGRSGSTTMLGMLNSIPGFHIAGEQLDPLELSLCEDALVEIAAAASAGGHDNAARTLRRRTQVSKKWVGPMLEGKYGKQQQKQPPQQQQQKVGAPKSLPNSTATAKNGKNNSHGRVGAFLEFNFGGSHESAKREERVAELTAAAGDPEWWCKAQRVELDALHLESAPRGTVAVGRKAIRLDEIQTLEFLRALFPCAQFVLTYRLDETLQAHSGFWGKHPPANLSHQKDGVISLLDNMTVTLKRFEELHPGQVFALPLEKFSVPRFNELLAWLGVRGCSFTSVCHANAHSGYTACDNTGRLNGTCVVADL